MKKSTLKAVIAFYVGYKAKEFVNTHQDCFIKFVNKSKETVGYKIGNKIMAIIFPSNKTATSDENFIFKTRLDAMEALLRLSDEADIVKIDGGWKIIFPDWRKEFNYE